MKNKILWIITALSFILSAVSVNFLPERIPMHYDINGVVDRYGSRYEVFTYSVLILIIAAVMTFIAVRQQKSTADFSDDKEKEMKKNNSKVISVIGICLTAVEFIMQCVSQFSTIASSGSFGFLAEIDSFKLNMSALSFTFGIMFIVAGNIMPKLKRNEMVGLRTNATMENDLIWQKSNRFAGKAFVICGFCSVISAFTFKGLPSVIITVILVILVSVISSLYAASLESGKEN